jgi:hypothetical protein
LISNAGLLESKGFSLRTLDLFPAIKFINDELGRLDPATVVELLKNVKLNFCPSPLSYSVGTSVAATAGADFEG